LGRVPRAKVFPKKKSNNFFSPMGAENPPILWQGNPKSFKSSKAFALKKMEAFQENGSSIAI